MPVRTDSHSIPKKKETVWNRQNATGQIVGGLRMLTKDWEVVLEINEGNKALHLHIRSPVSIKKKSQKLRDLVGLEGICYMVSGSARDVSGREVPGGIPR